MAAFVRTTPLNAAVSTNKHVRSGVRNAYPGMSRRVAYLATILPGIIASEKVSQNHR